MQCRGQHEMRETRARAIPRLGLRVHASRRKHRVLSQVSALRRGHVQSAATMRAVEWRAEVC